MNYYFNTTLSIGFEQAIVKVTEALAEEGFGILTEIDVQKTLKKKLNVDFKQYVILGACNPSFAHEALKAEDKIGVFLPCNVIVEENDDGSVEVSAVNPISSMMSVQNDALGELALQIQTKLKNVIDTL